MYRGLVGALVDRRRQPLARRLSARPPLPAQHFLRSLSGVIALCAVVLRHRQAAARHGRDAQLHVFVVAGCSFVLGGAVTARRKASDLALALMALAGFVGVVLVLQPTIAREQWWAGLVGLLSGVVSAAGYLQVAALGRAGEPESRIVFYFSVGGIVGGAASSNFTGWHAHSLERCRPAAGRWACWQTAAQLMLTRAFTRAAARWSTPVSSTWASASRSSTAWRCSTNASPGPQPSAWLLIVAAGVFATALRTPPPPPRAGRADRR